MDRVEIRHTKTMWTTFTDMNSGGFAKLDFSVVVIPMPEEYAKIAFEALFDISPDSTGCECCGNNFGYIEYDSEEEMEAGLAGRYTWKDADPVRRMTVREAFAALSTEDRRELLITLPLRYAVECEGL